MEKPQKMPKVAKVKSTAEIQITAEQLLREAKERDLEILPPPPKQKISDPHELAAYHGDSNNNDVLQVYERATNVAPPKQNAYIQVNLKDENGEPDVLKFLEKKGVKEHIKADEKTLFVELCDHHQAVQLNGFNRDGNLMMLAPQAACVILKNIPDSINAEELENSFSEYAILKSVKIFVNEIGEKKAIFEFNNITSAINFIDECNAMCLSFDKSLLPITAHIIKKREKDLKPSEKSFKLVRNDGDDEESKNRRKTKNVLDKYEEEITILTDKLFEELKKIQLSKYYNDDEQAHPGTLLYFDKPSMEKKNGLDKPEKEKDEQNIIKKKPTVTSDEYLEENISIRAKYKIRRQNNKSTPTLQNDNLLPHVESGHPGHQELATDLEMFKSNRDESMRKVVDADTTLQNDRGKTPLHESLEFSSLNTADIVISETPCGSMTRYGESPLHIPAKKNTEVDKFAKHGENSSLSRKNKHEIENYTTTVTTAITLRSPSSSPSPQVENNVETMNMAEEILTTIPPLTTTADDQRNKNDNSLTNLDDDNDLTEIQLRRSGRKIKQSLKSRENEETEKMPKVKTRRLIKKRRKAINAEPVVYITQVNIDQPTEIIHPGEIPNAEPVVPLSNEEEEDYDNVKNQDNVRDKNKTAGNTKKQHNILEIPMLPTKRRKVINHEKIGDQRQDDVQSPIEFDDPDTSVLEQTGSTSKDNTATDNIKQNKKRSVPLSNEEEEDYDNVKNQDNVRDKNKTAGNTKKHHNILEIPMLPTKRRKVINHEKIVDQRQDDVQSPIEFDDPDTSVLEQTGSTSKDNTATDNIKQNKKRSVPSSNEEKEDYDNVKNQDNVSDKNQTDGDGIFHVNKQHNIVELKMSSTTKYGVTFELLEKFENLLLQLTNNEDCNIVLLTSAGQHFSQELDLSILYNKDTKKIQEFATRLKKLIKSLSTFNKTIVAAIQGPVTGFFVNLLPFFDMVIASGDSSFSTPYGLIKKIAKDFDITKISYFFESPMANNLLLSGKTLSAKEALKAGIISRVLQTETFHHEVILFLQSTSDQIITEIQKLTLENKLKAELHFQHNLLIQLIDHLLSKK